MHSFCPVVAKELSLKNIRKEIALYAKIKFKNALIICLWFCLAGLVAAIALLWFFSYTVGLIFFAVWFLIFGVFLCAYICTFKIHIASAHISLRHGMVFKFVHRAPLRFISSCRIITTPLQRRTKSCVVILLYAGGFFVLPGADINFANMLLEKTVSRSD